MKEKAKTVAQAVELFTAEVLSLFHDALTAITKADKYDTAAKVKTRTFLDAAYQQIAGSGPVTGETMQQARAAILAKLQQDKHWPKDEKNKPVGYVKGRDAGAVPCIQYNQLQALIGYDLTQIKKAVAADEEAKATPEQREEKTKKAAQEKVTSAFHNFIKLFDDLAAADKAFCDLMATAKTAKAA